MLLRHSVGCLLLIALMAMTGCNLFRPREVPAQPPTQKTTLATQLKTVSPDASAYKKAAQKAAVIGRWLKASQTIDEMPISQAKKALVQYQQPQREGLELFRYGLLNQRVNSATSLPKAAAAFTKIRHSTWLDDEYKEVARLHLVYVNHLINMSRNKRTIQQQLADAVVKQQELQRTINALTNVEATMSQRKQADTEHQPDDIKR